LFTAISFQEKYSALLGGGDLKHKFFVKVLKDDCEGILWPNVRAQDTQPQSAGQIEPHSGTKPLGSDTKDKEDETTFFLHSLSW
jgi:hypothetical protein